MLSEQRSQTLNPKLVVVPELCVCMVLVLSDGHFSEQLLPLYD